MASACGRGPGPSLNATPPHPTLRSRCLILTRLSVELGPLYLGAEEEAEAHQIGADQIGADQREEKRKEGKRSENLEIERGSQEDGEKEREGEIGKKKKRLRATARVPLVLIAISILVFCNFLFWEACAEAGGQLYASGSWDFRHQSYVSQRKEEGLQVRSP